MWHRRQDGRFEERYERYSEGHLERMLDLLTDDFVWVGDDSGLPGSGRHERKQAAIDVLQSLGAYDKYERPLRNSLSRAMRSSCSGTKKVGGVKGSVRLPFVNIWRFRGEQVCSVQVLNDTLTTARLLDLA